MAEGRGVGRRWERVAEVRALTKSPMVMVPAWMPCAHITMVAVSATLKMALCPKLSRDRLLWVLRAAASYSAQEPRGRPRDRANGLDGQKIIATHASTKPCVPFILTAQGNDLHHVLHTGSCTWRQVCPLRASGGLHGAPKPREETTACVGGAGAREATQ